MIPEENEGGRKRFLYRRKDLTHAKMKCVLSRYRVRFLLCFILIKKKKRKKKEQIHCKPVCVSCSVAFSFPVNDYIWRVKKKKSETPWYLKSNLCVCLCWGKGSAFDHPPSSPAKMSFKESSSSPVQIPTGAARTHVERCGNVAASLRYLCHTTRAVLPDNGGRNSHGSDFPKTLGFKNAAPISFLWDFWDFGYSWFIFSSFCFHSERPREIKN